MTSELLKEKRTKVLIVDDSEAMCQFLTRVLSSDNSIKVVGHALDAYQARDMIKLLQPDVLTLDIEMPRMDGITFLKNLMRLRPMPVVMLSSLTAAGAEVTLRALSIGAVDFLVKRHPGGNAELREYVNNITSVVKAAATAKLRRIERPKKPATKHTQYPAWKSKFEKGERQNEELSRIIGIGASTGGPEALRELLENFNTRDCAIVISQHMPKRFMKTFSERLNSISSFQFAEATHNEPIVAGRGYVAPGDHHLEFRRATNRIVTAVSESEKRNGHRPSVDVMFESLASQCPNCSLGILLTGMGHDGAIGMKAMRTAGSLTFAQDEASSAVWGMPGSAVRNNGADGQLSLQEIGPTLQHLLNNID